MADIGSLIVKIGADASEFTKAMEQMGGSAKQFQRGLETISKVVSTAFFAATSAAVAMTIAAGKTAEETDQLAQKTGIAADSLEGMTVLMTRNGLNAQSMAQAVKGLSKEMVGVQQGTASSIKLFQDLGLNLAVVEKGTGATLRAIADRFKELPDGANKARIAVELFGKAGLDWIPILNKGSAAMDEAMKKSAEFGLVLSETARSNLTAFDDAMDDMQSALKGFAMQVGVAFAPSAIILVRAFTDVIVFTKNIFNQLSDAGSTLSIRLAAMVASVQILSSTLFSMNAFSKAAWEETLHHVKAIDAWAAAEIQGVESARAANTELEALALNHLSASQAVETHTASQKILGEQIVSFTKIQLQQAEAAGKQQERLGANIVATSKISQEIAQEEAQAWVESYLVQETASMDRFKAEIDALDRNEEAQGRFIVEQAIAAQQVKGFWTTQLEALVASNAFSVSQIVTTWTSGLANAIVNGGNFVQAAWKSTQLAIIQGGLNLAVQWGAQQALMVAQTAGAATLTTAIWGGATTAITGFFAATSAAFTAMVANMVAIMTAVGEFVMGVLSAIAEALTATVFGIPWAGAIVVGIALIAAALAATGNLGFKEGGIGDFGSGTAATLHGPEAIIPLNSRGADFLHDVFGMDGKADQIIHTHVFLNRRQIALAISDETPGALRTMGTL
jgi:hypothetical protein